MSPGPPTVVVAPVPVALKVSSTAADSAIQQWPPWTAATIAALDSVSRR